jgi:hypothetical protein
LARPKLAKVNPPGALPLPPPPPPARAARLLNARSISARNPASRSRDHRIDPSPK